MTVISQLGALESAGLIRLIQYEPDLEYLFRHALVQDAAYATLLAPDRKRLHRVVGEALEQIYPDRLNEYAAMLARHFEQAGDAQHALEYFARAGEAALAAYANQEAEGQFLSALALPSAESLRPSLLSGLGEAVYRQSRFGEAIQTWREAIDLYQDGGDMDGVARLYARSARAAWHSGDHPWGLELCQEGLQVIDGAPESPDVALLMHEAGRAHYFNAQPDRALSLCEQALEIAERLDAVDVQADTLATMGVLSNLPAAEAKTRLLQAVELSEVSGLTEIAVRAHHNLGVAYKSQGDLQAGREHFRRAADLAHQRGAAQEELFSLSSAIATCLSIGDLAAVEKALPELECLVDAIPGPGFPKYGLSDIKAALLEMRGEWTEALHLRREYYQAVHERGDLQGVLDASTSLAGLLLELQWLGELDTARAIYAAMHEAETVLLEAKEINDRGLGDVKWAHYQLVILRAAQGRFQEARALLAQEQQPVEIMDTIWEEMGRAIAQARLAAAEARWPDALAHLEALANIQARTGQRWGWARTLLERAQVQVARGEPADLQRAQALLREAQTAFREMGTAYYEELVAERLKDLRARSLAQVVTLGKAAQELVVAGRIQAGLLPTESPYIPGWQLAATLEPARETSGDFYDFIPLPNGLLGIVVADVADKGAGAALYMALSRTLIRTYAADYATQPNQTLAAANRRILGETHTDMFVTLFYGILEPESGSLTYCNAGHNPPLLLKAGGIETLGRTGLPLGILEDAAWEQGAAQLGHGDALVIYTDGATDAQTAEGVLFGQERLLDVVRTCQGGNAQKMQDAILEAIHNFVGDAPRFDDLTLMVVTRT